MGEVIKALIYYPTREDIVAINLYHIENTGGFCQGAENLLNPNSLEWVLYAIQQSLYDLEPYPTIVEKASILVWVIISRHVFLDANKRTGISVLKTFLRTNGYDVEASDTELIEIALSIAESKKLGYSQEDFTRWIRNRLCLR